MRKLIGAAIKVSIPSLIRRTLMCLIVSVLLVLPMESIASENHLTIDFREWVTNVALQTAISSTLENRNTAEFPGNRFAVTFARFESYWALVSLASIDGEGCSDEHIGSGNCGRMLLAVQRPDLTWQAELQGTNQFTQLMQGSPPEFLEPRARIALDPLLREPENASELTYTDFHKFPWLPIEWEYWNGWHYGAIDIGVHGATTDKRVLASADGYVVNLCKGSISANIAINHDDGTDLEYFHLVPESIPSNIQLGERVLQGQRLGTLVSGTFTDTCGYALQQTDAAHIHWVLPTDEPFTADGWTIEYPDNTWWNDTLSRLPKQEDQPYETLLSTNYMLVKQIKFLESWYPSAWPYLFTASDSRVRGFTVDGNFSVMFEEDCDSVWTFLEYGTHNIEFWYELRGETVPTIDIQPWPVLVGSVCAAEPTDPPEESDILTIDDAEFDNVNMQIVIPGQTVSILQNAINTGTTIWSDGYQLVFVGGEQMGAPDAINIPLVNPGEETDLSISLVAPSTPGRHIGYWRLRNAQDTFFGPTLSVELIVETDSSYVTVFSTDPPSPADTSAVQIHAKIEEFPNLRATRLLIDNEVVYEIGGPEFTYTWHTDGYEIGDHSLVVQVADQTDTSWSHPEQRSLTYTLLGTEVTVNHSPFAPSLISPYDWYVYYSGDTAQLCAQGNGDPDGDSVAEYFFEIYDSAQLWNSGWIGNGCVSTSALGPYNYQWRVKVRDPQGAESDWSDTWHFTLVNPALSISELYFEPQDADSENVKIRACTTGQGGIGITMRVSVNTANDGSDSGEWLAIKELGVPCFTADDAPLWRTLEYLDGTHLIRVEAHALDASWDGAAVREATYTLPHRRPPEPQLVAPVPVSQDVRDPVYLNSRTVTFQWEPTLRTSGYTLHVGTSPSPETDPNPLLRQTLSSDTTNHIHTFDQDYPVLYWQLTAINDKGTSTWFDQQFGIDRESPTCIVSPLPETSFDDVFQVAWDGSDAVSGIQNYHIQYLDSKQDTWQDWLIDIPSTKTYELFKGQNGHSYEFRCRAVDNAENTGVYPTDGDTFTLVDPTSLPATLWWDSAYSEKRNIVILNNMSSAVLPAQYPVRLQFDSTTVPSAADIYNASQSSTKCNDLRVISNDLVELDRLVTICTVNEIEVFFRTQDSIPGSAVSDRSVQLYIGNPSAGLPPSDPNNVWYPESDSHTRALVRMQEGSGAIAYDSSDYGNHCSFGSSELSWSSGKFEGEAVNFPGQNPNGPALNCGNNGLDVAAFTIEAWIKRNSLEADVYRLAGQIEDGVPPKYLFRLRGDYPELVVWPCTSCGASGVISDVGVHDLLWHHIAVTFDSGNQVKFYIDGNLVNVKSLAYIGWSSSPAHLQVGGSEDTNRFDGDMSFFRLSDIARTTFPYGGFSAITSEPTLMAGSPQYPPEIYDVDLVMLDVSTYNNPTGGIIVQSVIQNQGAVDTLNGFYTDVFIDSYPETDSVAYWTSDSVAANDIVTLTQVITDVIPTVLESTESGIVEYSGTLYNQVDTTGVIRETDEDNNSITGVEFCLASVDEYEADDSAVTASALVIDQPQTHNFHKPGDEDWYEVTLDIGTSYVISTTDLGPANDTYVYLYDRDATTILTANDDYSGTLTSRIEWTAMDSDTYYVRVKHWNPNMSGCGTQYTIHFNEISPPTPIQPDIQPVSPDGYSYPITPSSVPNTTEVDTLFAGQPTYFDWWFFNAGASTELEFYVDIWIDDILVSHTLYAGLDEAVIDGVVDWTHIISDEGWHTLKIEVDPENAVIESNEMNNIWQEPFYWESIPEPTISLTASIPDSMRPWHVQADLDWCNAQETWHILDWQDGTDTGLFGSCGSEIRTHDYELGTHTMEFSVYGLDGNTYTQSATVEVVYGCGDIVSLDGVVLFQGQDCVGPYEQFTKLGSYDLTTLDDLATSLHLPDGYSVMLFEDLDNEGQSYCTRVDMWNLDIDTWPDGSPMGSTVSSVKIYDNRFCRDKGKGNGKR